jgi:hypothetical protein
MIGALEVRVMLFPRPLLACLLALACTAPPAFAVGAGQAFGPGTAFGDERTVALRLTAVGTVVAIDARARLMTVDGARGAITYRLDPIVSNARAIRVGERVQVDYVAAFLLSRRRDSDDAADWTEPPRGRIATASLADDYARPVTFVASVLSVDKDNLVVRLRGPGGDVSAYPVNDRSALAGIREGDQVHVLMNQAVAVGVTPVRR